MLRAGLAVVAASVLLAYPLGCGKSVDNAVGPAGASAHAEGPGIISIRERTGEGAWRPSLSLRLVKTKLITFSVCALWNESAAADWGTSCASADGAQLPTGTVLRLEQSPVGKAVKRADSPGWGMVAVSDSAALEAVLSNTLNGNKYGTLRYRATLRDTEGKILAASRAMKLVWHR
jgi:hypothetical protein